LKTKQDLFPKLREIFFKRISLFLHGNRDGVRKNFLQKSTNGIFLSTKDFMINSKLNYSDLLDDISTAKTLYKRVLEDQRLITNERWNAELELFSLLYVLVKSKKPQIISRDRGSKWDINKFNNARTRRSQQFGFIAFL